jgi:CubicO group peptidase (beta-lactamase class C family)
MKRHLFAVATLIFVTSVPGEGQLPRVQIAAIDSVFSRFDTDTLPGCVVGVMRDGQLIFGKGYGLANMSTGMRLTPSTTIGIASLTKQFTAAAVAILVQEGRINADADIREYIPEMPIYAAPIRVRDLVYQTTGLRDYLSILGLRGQDAEAETNDAEILRLITRQRNTNHEPGSAYAYSNTNYYLLGEVVRRVTGLSLREFAEQRLFRVLRMSATRYALPGEPLRNAAASYRLNGERLTEARMSGALGGDGGMYTTLEDLARWDGNFIRPVLTADPAAYVGLISQDGTTRSGVAIGYGWGNQINQYRGLSTHGHGGTWFGYRVQYLRFPTERVGLAVLCNQLEISPFQLIRSVADIVLRDRFRQPAPAPGAGPLAGVPATPVAALVDSVQALQYVGDYWSDDLDVRFRIARDSQSLVLRSGYATPMKLRIAHPDTLEALPRTFIIERNGAGQVTGFVMYAGRVRNVVFERMDGPSPKIQIPRGRVIEVDGVAHADEWTDAREVSIKADGEWLIPVRVKHDGENLLFAFFNLRSGIVRVPEIVIDAKYGKTAAWNENDWWFHASARDCAAAGRFNDYTTCVLDAREWSATNIRGMTFPAVMEVRIPMRLIAVAPGGTIGIAFNVTDTRAVWRFWPAGAQLAKPASWAEATILN